MRKVIQYRDALVNGLLASAGLLAFYFIVLRLTNPSWNHAIEQFRNLWLWMLLLDFGFGIQIGLYTYLRSLVSNGGPAKITSTSAGVSAGSMIACCAHHVADALPIIGLSGIAFFLTEYQVWFIILGIVSNILGIGYITKHIRTISATKKNPAIIYPTYSSLQRSRHLPGGRMASWKVERVAKPLKTSIYSLGKEVV